MSVDVCQPCTMWAIIYSFLRLGVPCLGRPHPPPLLNLYTQRVWFSPDMRAHINFPVNLNSPYSVWNWKWADRATTGHIPHHLNYFYNYMYKGNSDLKREHVVIPWKINTYYREVQSEYRNYYNTTTLLVLVLGIQSGLGEVWSSFPSLCCLPQHPPPILREIVAIHTAVEMETEI